MDKLIKQVEVKLKTINSQGRLMDVHGLVFQMNDETLILDIGGKEYSFTANGELIKEEKNVDGKNLTIKNIITELQKKADIYLHSAEMHKQAIEVFERLKNEEGLEDDKELIAKLLGRKRTAEKKAEGFISSISVLRSTCSHNYANGQSALELRENQKNTLYECQICGFKSI